MNQPHSKYRHVYAIVRRDPEMLQPEHQVSVPKVFLSEEAAEREAERLNTLNGSKGACYMVYISHLVEAEEPVQTG